MATLVSLEEMKTYLSFPNPDQPNNNDDMITEFMESATEVVTGECGELVQTTYDEWYQGGDTQIFLRHFPVYQVVQVEENWGFTNYVLSEQPGDTDPQNTSLWAFSLDQPNEGIVTRRSVGNVVIPFVNVSGGDNIRIQYIGGRETVPANIRHAYMDLVAIWWQGSQQRQVAGSGMSSTNYGSAVPEGAGSGYNAGVPYRILEILRRSRRTPIIG